MFEQERVIVRLQQRVAAEPDILVCFLSGSFGRRTQDAFSDLDVALVFADEERRAVAYGRRREFAQSVLPYVPARAFDADHVRPYFFITLYSNGAKVDYRYETKDTLPPNPWDKELRLLKDSDGWGARFQATSAATRLPQPAITAAELTNLDNRFWVMLWDVYRLLRRGDYDKPYPIYLQLLHFTAPALLEVLPVEEPVRQAFMEIAYGRDTRATIEHLRQLLAAYLKARSAVVQRYNLLFTPDRAFETAIQNLLRK